MCTSKCKTPFASPVTGMEVDDRVFCKNCGDGPFFVTKEEIEKYADLEIRTYDIKSKKWVSNGH